MADHTTATENVIQIPGYHSGMEDRLAIFEAIPSPHKVLAIFRGIAHSLFADHSFTGGRSLNAKVQVATADLALAFFNLIFEGDGATLAEWQTIWHSILARTPAPMPHIATGWLTSSFA